MIHGSDRDAEFPVDILAVIILYLFTNIIYAEYNGKLYVVGIPSSTDNILHAFPDKNCKDSLNNIRSSYSNIQWLHSQIKETIEGII